MVTNLNFHQKVIMYHFVHFLMVTSHDLKWPKCWPLYKLDTVPRKKIKFLSPCGPRMAGPTRLGCQWILEIMIFPNHQLSICLVENSFNSPWSGLIVISRFMASLILYHPGFVGRNLTNKIKIHQIWFQSKMIFLNFWTENHQKLIETDQNWSEPIKNDQKWIEIEFRSKLGRLKMMLTGFCSA